MRVKYHQTRTVNALTSSCDEHSEYIHLRECKVFVTLDFLTTLFFLGELE